MWERSAELFGWLEDSAYVNDPIKAHRHVRDVYQRSRPSRER